MILAFLLFGCCISFPADVFIDGDTIQLGALAAFPPDDPRASIAVGYSPSPGLGRRIPNYEIMGKLQSAGLPTEDLRIPESILVRRRAAALDRDQVSRVILDAFIRQFPSANVEIENMEIPAVQIETGPVQLTASLPPRFDPTASVFVRLEARGARYLRNAFVRTNVRIETEQPVVKNPIAAHSAVREEDLEMKRMPVKGMPAQPQSLDGLLAKRDLTPGQVLTADALYAPMFVQKGDSVTVKAISGSITVAATMRAKSSGRYGDTIQVEHLSGDGATSAVIVGPRLLEIGSSKSDQKNR